MLVVRVLYRLRFLSEKAPFDAATFSYAFPLLAEVVSQGGIGVQEQEEALEQIALALDVIKFHCGECMLHQLDLMGRLSILFYSLKSSVPPYKDNGNTAPDH